MELLTHCKASLGGVDDLTDTEALLAHLKRSSQIKNVSTIDWEREGPLPAIPVPSSRSHTATSLDAIRAPGKLQFGCSAGRTNGLIQAYM
jgi:hypothetical protein